MDCSDCDYVKWIREDRGEWHGQPCSEPVIDCSLGYDPSDCPHIEKEEDDG